MHGLLRTDCQVISEVGMTKQDIADARAWLKEVYSPDSLVSVRDKLDQAYLLVKRFVGEEK
jgi:hypothetical protein